MTSTSFEPPTAQSLDISSLSVAAKTLCVPIRAYQAVRAGHPSPCRFWPSCSTYALEALTTHGAARGGWLTVRRLLRCHPWAARSGVDPVPAARTPPSRTSGLVGTAS